VKSIRAWSRLTNVTAETWGIAPTFACRVWICDSVAFVWT
jgi:hypothetical protein